MKNRDKISELPIDVMHRILPLLPPLDRIRYITLSKTWKNAWTKFPILEFDGNLFYSASNWYEWMDFVDQSLRSRHEQMINISKLTFDVVPCCISRVDQWLGYALKCNLQELTLDIQYCNYTLSQAVLDLLVLKSLVVLTIRGSLWFSGTAINTNLSLKKLSLSFVSIDEVKLQNLLDNCPELEDFELNMCCGLTSVKIIDLHKLKNVKLVLRDEIEEVEIRASHLSSIDYSGYGDCEINISACENLRRLALTGAPSITGKWLHDHFLIFCFLEVLELHACPYLERVNISGDFLKVVSLTHCKRLVEVEIDTRDLLCFTYHGKDTTPISLNPRALPKANLFLYGSLNVGQVTQFLGQFNNCNIENLYISSNKALFIREKGRETLLPALYNVTHLTFEVLKTLTSQEIVELVDGLLWIFHRPLTLSLIFCGDKCNISMKFIYENQMSPCSCTNLGAACWRDCLKEVKIDNYRGMEHEKHLKEFFSGIQTSWRRSMVSLLPDFLEKIDGFANT